MNNNKEILVNGRDDKTTENNTVNGRDSKSTRSYLDNLRKNLTRKKTFKVFEAFAGLGSQRLALERIKKRLNVKFEYVGIAENNKYASKAYKALHGETKNFEDIREMDYENEGDCDVLTWSSPCQSNSASGTQEGFAEGSGTKSAIAWCLRPFLEAKKKTGKLPLLILFENVPRTTSGKNASVFKQFLEMIESFGYHISWEIVDSLDYGVAQRRKRVFCVCSLVDIGFEFPKPREGRVYLRDILEKDVSSTYDFHGTCVPERSYNEASRIMNIHNPSYADHSGTIVAHGPGGCEDYYVFREDVGTVPKVRFTKDFLAENNITKEQVESTQVRTFTELEVMRLMGLNEDEIARLQTSGLCKTRMYSALGNSIVVNVLEDIFMEYFSRVLELQNEVFKDEVELKGKLEEIIDLHDQMKGSYFFSPPRFAKSRRRYEEARSMCNSFEFQGVHYMVEQLTTCSCKHVYYNMTIFIDGLDSGKDIRLIKKMYKCIA